MNILKEQLISSFIGIRHGTTHGNSLYVDKTKLPDLVRHSGFCHTYRIKTHDLCKEHRQQVGIAVKAPIHGSWPQAKGQNIANPLAQILSVAMLFEYFNLMEEGALIRRAVTASLDANVRTPEIQVAGGAVYGTREVGAWIADWIRNASLPIL